MAFSSYLTGLFANLCRRETMCSKKKRGESFFRTALNQVVPPSTEIMRVPWAFRLSATL